MFISEVIQNLSSKLAEAIYTLRVQGTNDDNIVICCPFYIQAMFVAAHVHNGWGTNLSELKFMGITLRDGYENAIVVFHKEAALIGRGELIIKIPFK